MRKPNASGAEIADLRAFNRVYTARLGLLNGRLDRSAFSLTEARVLYELAHRSWPTAAEIARSLTMDRAHLSRILKRFTNSGLMRSRVSREHAKHRQLALTPDGKDAFARLNRATKKAVGGLLSELSPNQRRSLLRAAGKIVHVFERTNASAPQVVLRGLNPGDLGWVIHRQGILYAREYGWDGTYEALVAEILAGFVKNFDPEREQAWIAELDGSIVGSIFLMQSLDPKTAKLRLLYVEPDARGLGIGRKLVDACITRAREIGCDTLELWTNSVLVSARRIYEAAGFELREEAKHHSFGQNLTGQVWALRLNAGRDR